MIFQRHPVFDRTASTVLVSYENGTFGSTWQSDPGDQPHIVAISRMWTALEPDDAGEVIRRYGLEVLLYDEWDDAIYMARTDTMAMWLLWLWYAAWLWLYNAERAAWRSLYQRCLEQGLVDKTAAMSPSWRVFFTKE